MKRVLSLLGIGTLALLVAVPANAKVCLLYTSDAADE